MHSKVTGLIFLFFLLNLGTYAQDVKITTNLPESLNPGQTYDLDVIITKGGVSSFAKFQMDLPFGFTAQPVETKGGNWTFDQQRAKIVWVSIPSDAEFTVKMKITAPGNALNSAVVTGKFFYLENNVKKEYDMPPHNIKFGGEPVATTNTVSSTNTNTVSTSNTNTVSTTNTNTVSTNTNTVSTTNTNTVTSTDPVTTNTVSTNTSNTNTSNNSNSSSLTGLIYRVQIGAFSTKPSKGKFPGIKEFWIYEDNGLFKATAGKFNSLNEAEAYKAQLRGQGMDGFVVAFQNGMRVKLR